MAYLSRVWLNPLRTETRGYLRNPQRMHASILGGLSRQPVTERVLWRLDTPSPHRLDLLILTESRPSWEHLIESGGWPGADEPQALVRSYDPLLQQLSTGREFTLKLRANPVSATRKPDAPSQAQQHRLDSQPRPRGVRVAHRTAGHQLTWFCDRAPQWGFTILGAENQPTAQVTERGRLSFTKRDNDTSRQVTLQTATYHALVRIENPDATRRSLLCGVGAGKAYGLGLITLAPPPTDLSCGG